MDFTSSTHEINEEGLSFALFSLMLGVCALLGGAYVTSNRESGDGRYDIQLMPEYDHLPGVLIELKAEKACSQEKLKELAGAALQQTQLIRLPAQKQHLMLLGRKDFEQTI